jgi:hypothetical protein
LITQYGSTVLSELPQENVLKVLCAQLMRLAKMYQIKDFDFENAVILGQWIVTNYKYEQLETVTRCLENPPSIGEKVWRITPDVISDWFAAYLDKLYASKEKEIHNQKFIEEPEGEADPRLAEWLKELETKEKGIRPITEEEIKYEGGEKPGKPKYIPPGVEYYILAQKKAEYGRECTDLHTGKVKAGMPSFEEWLTMGK